jgi:Xaa-Pro dipeptidase
MNQKRLEHVIEHMKQRHLSQIIVSSTASIYYLTGIWIDPFERLLALYIRESGEAVLFANEIFGLAPQSGMGLSAHTDCDNPVEQLAETVKSGEIGIDKFWSAKFLIGLMEFRKDIHPVNGSEPVDFARMIKDEDEIEAMRQASRVNDQVVERTISAIRVGIRETDLSDLVEKQYAENGGNRSPEGQLVCFGANGADPHHFPENVEIQTGDSVILDIFNPIRRYWCDMTRTVFYRSAAAEQKKVYETVLQANRTAEDLIRPGLPLCDFDRAARKVIEDAGYGKYFTHRLGHGAGLECHEIPDNSAASQVIARPGMVFSVEPGIYLPGKFGIRIEDLVLVTEDGCEVLNQAPKEFRIVE